MEILWGQVRHTLRRLVRNPVTSLAAVVTMALGIGVTTGAYSIVDGLMLRGVPFDDAQRLVSVKRSNLSRTYRSTRVPEHDVLDWRERQQCFEALIAYHTGSIFYTVFLHGLLGIATDTFLYFRHHHKK